MVVAGAGDRLAGELLELAQERGRRAVRLDAGQAARMLTITVDGLATAVEPPVGMLLRPPAPPLVRESWDDYFARCEEAATLWAAAALTSAPVLNRPTADGMSARWSHSSSVNDLRRGAAPRRETFAGSPPPPPDDGPAGLAWYMQDAVTYRTARWPELPPGDGPYRARWSDEDPAYEVVAVLGEDAWRCTVAKLDHLELERRSIEAALALDLGFAAVTWTVAHDVGSAAIVRVDAYPAFEQVRFVWPALGPALLDALAP